MLNDTRIVTLRRNLQQAIHCLVEAASVLENNEDPRCAKDDVFQALELIRIAIMPEIITIVNLH